jgi:hypothetical protein
MALNKTDYGLIYNDDGSLCVTIRKDDVPFEGVVSFAVEEGTTNLLTTRTAPAQEVVAVSKGQKYTLSAYGNGNAMVYQQHVDDTQSDWQQGTLSDVVATASGDLELSHGVDAVVYYDTRYPTSWINRTSATYLRDFLVSKGFSVKNADELKTWMQKHISAGTASGAVCVMAQDIAPDTIVETKDTNCTLRQFLNAGGRIVWLGDWQLYYQGHADGTKTVWGSAGSTDILGFTAQVNNDTSSCTITTDGTTWGLDITWTSMRALEASKTPHVTLAKSVGGYPCAYVWYFDSTLSKGGFVRLHDIIIDYSNQALAQDVYDVAIYGLVNYAQPYKLSGSRTSPILDLSHVGTASGSSIAWTATTPAGTSVTVETNLSLDGGQTWQGWQQVTNGGPIPGISAGTDLSNARLQTRVTLQTTDSTVTPRVHSLTVEVGHQAVAVAAESLSQSSPLTFTAVGNRVRLVPSAGVTKWQLEHKPFATSFVDGTRPAGIVKLSAIDKDFTSKVVSAWFKINGATMYNRIFDMSDGSTDVNKGWAFYYDKPYSGFIFNIGPSGIRKVYSSPEGKWFFVVLIFNNGTYTVKLYDNSGLVWDQTFTATMPDLSNNIFKIGNVDSAGGYARPLNGLVANLLIANYDPTTWTDEYIKFLYETQKPFFV